MEELAEALRPHIKNISDLEKAMRIIFGEGCGVIIQGVGEIWITTDCFVSPTYEIVRSSDSSTESNEG